MVEHDEGPGRDSPLVWLVRHGETEWSRTGRHTSRTEVDLTPAGEAEALSLQPVLAGANLDLVLCSPRLRARRTAEIAGLVPFVVWEDLQEWDYGDLEGLTTAEIQERLPGWSIWSGPWPGGETADDVAARADRVIENVLASGASRVGLVGHGHFSRVVAARWVAEDVSVGRWLDLDTGTVSQLGWYRSSPVLCCWNVARHPRFSGPPGLRGDNQPVAGASPLLRPRRPHSRLGVPAVRQADLPGLHARGSSGLAVHDLPEAG